MSPSTKLLQKEVVQVCRRALSDIGFKKCPGGEDFERVITPNVVGGVGLSIVPDHLTMTVEVNPLVGVRFAPIEEIIDRIMYEEAGEHPSRYKGTLGIHLGYLMPENTYTPWTFSEKSDLDDLARRMAEAVVEYGLPFMELHSTLEAVYESLVTRRFGGIVEFFAYPRPVAALLLGDIDAAWRHLSDGLERLGSRTDPAAQRYQKFARGFRRILEKESVPG